MADNQNVYTAGGGRVLNGSVMVLCCGCCCYLGKGGVRIPTEGSVSFALLGSRRIPQPHPVQAEHVAIFPDAERAEAAAIASGWSTKNRLGESDHRCPDCRRREQEQSSEQLQYRGAIVPAELICPASF